MKFYSSEPLTMSFSKPPDGAQVDVDLSSGSYETDDPYVIEVLQADANNENSPISTKPPKAPSKE